MFADLLPGQGAANRLFVGALERTVGAVVDTVIADVQRREKNDPVAVNLLLELAGGCEDFLDQLGLIGHDQGCGFLNAQGLFGQALGDDIPNQSGVGTIALEQPRQIGVIDKISLGGYFSCWHSTHDYTSLT